MSKAVKSEPSESFAITYFSQNPIDTRPPQQKLEDIESKLTDGNLERSERFSLIVQKRTLCQLLHGETSPEFIRATTELAQFYNSQNKADSACRNLTKATQYAKQVELSEEDEFALAVELADANLNASAPSKLEKAKQVALADIQLTPYAEYQSPNKMSCFRRDLCLARIRSFRTKWEEALAFYELALQQYPETHPPPEKTEEEEQGGGEEEKVPEEANIYVEAAQVAERIQGCEKAPGFYKKAYDMYVKLGYEEDAARIEEKLPEEVDEEEP
jgi:tetratricopeptide (TPR) repeat protein